MSDRSRSNAAWILRRVAPFVLCLLVGGTTPALAAPTAAGARAPARAPAPADHLYRPPIDPDAGVIVDPFRAPPHPYAAGNRGLDYATVPLSPVRAIGGGVVIFAGPVGGALHVTVRHDDGLRSSYSFLAEIRVAAGARVDRGDAVGVSADRFHLGVRDLDGTYLDPERLFRERPRVHLVPGGDDDPVPSTDDGRDPSAAPHDPANDARSGGDVASVGAAPPPGAFDGVRLWMHNVVEARVETHAFRAAEALTAWSARRHACTPRGVTPPRPAIRRILVEVGGMGSTSSSAAITSLDTAALGYAPGDVVQFSYRGGRVPYPEGRAPTADLAGVPVTTYDERDSQGDLVGAGERLEDLLRRIASQAPGVPIDVVAHSQGGIVARLALEAPVVGAALPAAVRTLVTLGTPHQGADLAAIAVSTRSTRPGADLLADLGRVTGIELDPASPAAAQLIASSSVIRRLAHTPVAPGVHVTSIGARGDLVVPANRTVVAGGPAHHTVVALSGVRAHGDLPGSSATTHEIGLAVAGWPPACRGAAQVLADVVVAESVSLVESLAAVSAPAVAGRLRWPESTPAN